MRRPRLVVVIGANGAGKTTWARRNRHLLPKPFYNADSIAEGLGDANSTALQIRARTVVDREIAERLANHEDFGFESTWSGASRPAILRDAAARGYETKAIFLGTTNPEINIARVRRRVLEGGHHVPENEIRRRWHQAFANLLSGWHTIETIQVNDSSEEELVVIAEKIGTKTSIITTELPDWAKPIGVTSATGPATGKGQYRSQARETSATRAARMDRERREAAAKAAEAPESGTPRRGRGPGC